MTAPSDQPAPGVAQKLLSVLDGHPAVKLLALVWVGAASVIGPLYVWHKDRQEASRQGLVDPPSVTLGIAGTDCTLANLDRRPVVEATIAWRTYQLNVSACAVTSLLTGSHERSPAASAKELPPRELVTARYDLSEACRNVHALGCRAGDDCWIVVECQGRYHRMADLEQYTTSRYALSNAGCTELRDLHTLYSYQVQQGRELVRWHDTADERAYRCFSQGRARVEALRADLDRVTHRAEELALGSPR